MKPVKQEVSLVNEAKVRCEGKESLTDHPLIYLTIPEDVGYINCPYCSRQFKLNNKKTN